MSAIKKPNESAPEHYESPEVTPETAPLEDASGREDLEATESPARAMQAQLEQSIQSGKRRERIMDIGRVLASASGLTTLLGIFFYYGIW